jgi:hypothetical protein
VIGERARTGNACRENGARDNFDERQQDKAERRKRCNPVLSAPD